MIRIIVDKVDDKFVVDILNTRNAGQFHVARFEDFRTALVEVCMNVEKWQQLEEGK